MKRKPRLTQKQKKAAFGTPAAYYSSKRHKAAVQLNNELNETKEVKNVNKYFIYDLDGEGFETFATIEERDKVEKELIDLYKEEEWCDSVENIVSGEITKKSMQCDRIERPNELDADGYDQDGNRWVKGIEYMCNYRMKAV